VAGSTKGVAGCEALDYFFLPGEYDKHILFFTLKYFLTFTFTINPSKSWLTVTVIGIQFKVRKAIAIVLAGSLLTRRLLIGLRRR